MLSSLKDRIKSLVNRKKAKAAQTADQNGKDTNAPSTSQPVANPQAPVSQKAKETPYFAPKPPGQTQQQQVPMQTTDRMAVQAATTTGTLQIALQNNSTSNQVYAYITGIATDNNGAVFLLQADAKTPYYPPNPASTGTALGADVSIPLGAPGNTVTATIPRLAGGRIWFSIGAKLTFAVNPGPGLVEPSIFNESDPNHGVNFGFCEFTYNSSQVFVNVSYVDFVSGVPIALTLTDTSGATQHVSGMPANGLAIVAQGLRAQTAKDGRRWSSLIVQQNGQDLRVLSPNSGITLNPSWFQTYWTDYVNQVYATYNTTPLIVQTQASYGALAGRVNSMTGTLTYSSTSNGQTLTSSFPKPTAADIFSNSTGPFATGSNPQTNALIPRLAAAFNRSTLLMANNTPNGTQPAQYYTNATTNHYARVVHAANIDSLGYAFPYDDVTPDGGKGQEGAIFSFAPQGLLVGVGGGGAYAAK